MEIVYCQNALIGDEHPHEMLTSPFFIVEVGSYDIDISEGAKLEENCKYCSERMGYFDAKAKARTLTG